MLAINANEVIGHRKSQPLQFHAGKVVDLSAWHMTLNALVSNVGR
ncbi:hypothetical protein RE6C_00695 [Rhodopirellula europaea 6C]|uniref:Uncharacterized protein n=1 Tax=Rhodopirellula europaea 6C TaxID=1263867 RepID=M2A929_9BACT|nr:hypothetical protein RE6C_00695 [Rhodopirellula europaea 6C]